jgi:ribosomal protein S18 acetylase RimI-like enzyme
MGAVAPEMIIELFGADGLYRQREQVLAAYAESNADRLDDPFYSVERYWGRLEAYAARDGFSLATGRVGEELVGYALGFTLPAGARWWTGVRGEVDPDLLIEDGRRTFAFNELMVRPGWRRQGYARALHDTLLGARHERRATLLVRPDNVGARSAYLSWGWYKIADLQPFADAPVFEALVCELAGG